MPYPGIPPDKTDLMDKCVNDVMDQGHDKESSIAICHASIMKGEPFPDGITFNIDEAIKSLKLGAVFNKGNKERLMAVKDLASQISGHMDAMMPNPPPEMTPEEMAQMEQGNKPVKGDLVIFLPDDIAGAGAIKAAGDYILDVLLVPFGGPNGGKDQAGEYFGPASKTMQDIYPTIPALYYHGFSPDGKPMGEPEIIGKMVYDHTDSKGHWYKAFLDKANQYARRIWASALKHLARASSGSIAHMIRVAQDGFIKLWPVVEGSLIDTEGKRQACNAYAVALPAAKAAYKAAGMDLLISDKQAEAAGGNTPAPDKPNNSHNAMKGILEMEPTEVEKLIKDQVDAALKSERERVAAEAEKARIDAMEKELAALKAEKAEGRRLPGGQSPLVTKFHNIKRFDRVSASELGLVMEILQGAHKPVSDDLYRAMAVKALEGATNGDKEMGFALKGLGIDTAIKANELMYSTQASYGDEWVGVGYGTTLWEAIRNDVAILAKVPTQEIPQGQETFYDPVEGADPTWYKVAQTTADDATMGFPVASVPSSKAATDRSNETLAKIGARVEWSGELDEDSLIAMAPEIRRKLELSGAETIEFVIIDGDTETAGTTNINDIGGTPAATDIGLTINGFRKLALVTNTANSRSAAGAFGVEDYIQTLQLMGAAGVNALDVTKVGFIQDANTGWASLRLPEVMSRDQFSNPTVENGVLTRIFNREVLTSAFMHRISSVRLANTAGKIDQDTVANNAYGAILAVRWDQWKFGWKRKMTMETTRYPRSDSWEITALARFGLKYRDTEASAITYYVGV